jgi:hypothetical protein
VDEEADEIGPWESEYSRMI